MGADDNIICPYCSTLYHYDAELGSAESNPADCAWVPDAV
jgi:hypothetical protein